MRQLFYVMFVSLLMVGSADIFAKNRTRSRPSTPKRTTRTVKKSTPKRTVVKKSTPRKTTEKKSTIAPKKTRTDKKSTIKKTTTKKNEKPKAVSTSKIDKRQSKAMKGKNTAAAKKYGNKKSATKAYRSDLAKKNKYTSSTPPSTRPSHIPPTVVHGGITYQTRYSVLPGGGYGYMRYNPLTGMYYVMDPIDYLIMESAMMNAGYGHWDARGRPVTYGPGAGLVVLYIFLGCIVVVILIAVGRKVFS